MGLSQITMPIQAINPFLNKDKETEGPVVQAVNPFRTQSAAAPPGFDFLQEKESGGGIIEDLKGVKDMLFKDSEYFHEKGILRQLFSKEVLGPSALIEAGKKLGKDIVHYPAESVEAITRGLYAGAIEPIIETGIRMVIPGEPPIQKKIVETLRKPAELGEYSFLTKKKFPETADELRQGFEISGIIAPFTAAETLAARILPRLPVLATRGIAWIGAGQILHKPEEGSRAERAMWDIALLGVFELVGAAVRPMFRALKPKTSGTLANLAAGEKVTVQEAEGAAKEITERFALEQRAVQPNVKKMTDDLILGRDMVAAEEKVVARDLIEGYNKQFPNKRFPLEDIPGAARRLDGVENIGTAKIERLQKIKDALVKPFIEIDLQDLKQLVSELRQELSAQIPKEIKLKGRELSFVATDEQISASLSSATTMARNELKKTILSLEAQLARLASGGIEPTAQIVEQAVGPLPKKDILRILQEVRRKIDPKLLVKDKIVKLDQEILKTTNEVSEKSRMLQGILDSGQIAEKRIRERFPQMYDYQNYLKDQIKLQTPPPKIDRTAIDWQPNTIGYNNPYTKQAYKLWNKVNEVWNQKMPRILKTAKSREVGEIARERQRVTDALVNKHKEDIVKLVEKMPFQERTKIGLMINKYIPIEEGYAPLIRDIDLAIGKLGNAIVELNQQWVKDGLIPANAAFLTEETWFRNLGQYTRSFYTDAAVPTGEQIAAGTGKVQAFVNRSQFKKKLTLKEWGERALEFEGKTKAEVLQMSAKDVETTGLRAKQDYGWIYEADAVLEKTFKDSINNYTVMQWQDAVRKDPMLFSKTEAPGFVPVKSFLRPGVERDMRLGPLQDGWVHPGLSEELTFFAQNPRDAASVIFGEALSWWKIEKVAMGPAVFRNYVSGGGIQTDMAGFPIWIPKNGKTYLESTVGKNGYLKGGERYKFWRDKGLFGSDYFEVEISGEMERAVRGSTNPYSEMGKQLEKLSKKGKENFRYYGAIDHMHRQYLAEAALKNGATPEQAVHFANKWELDYRIVPQFLDRIRRGLGGYLFPFISFYTLMLPRIAETLATRPWVLLKYPIIAKSMEYVAMKKLGLTPDQVENGKPEFMKDQPYSVLLPWTDNQGNPQYFDMSYTVPFGSWETGFIDWAQYLEMGKTGGALGIARGLIENRDPFTEKPIWTDADIALGKKDEKIAVYLMRGVGPAATPHLMNIYGAATGEVIGFPFQRPRSMSQSLLRAVGLSTYSGGFNEASWKISELEQHINQINFALGKVIQDPTVGEQEKNNITEQAVESINELSLQISEITRSMPPAPGELNKGKQKEGSSNQLLKAVNPFTQ